MIVNRVFRSKVLIVGLLATFVLLVAPVREFAQGKAPLAAGGSMVGFIYAKDMKTPVPNAVVMIREVSSAKQYASRPTDAEGMYKITGIAEGRYVIGVSTTTGNFNFDYALIVKANEMAKLSVALTPGGKSASDDTNGKGFFSDAQNVVGVIIMVAGVATLVILATSKPSEASPIR